MDREQWIDRLTETCLGEGLGGEGPPDLSGRILARAGRPRRPLVFRWAAAAAALFAVGLLWMSWPRETVELVAPPTAYAAPAASGDYRIEGDGKIRRGAVVLTDEGTATLSMGGYAYVTMKPESSVQVAGEQNAEGIVLTRGEVECEVDADAEKLFTVRTEFGTVSVVGTHFTVQLTGEETEMNGRKMLVKVLAGAVLVTGLNGGQSIVNAAERRTWGRGARQAMTRLTTPAIADAKTPLEKEAVALGLQQRALQAKQQEIETQVLADADVAATMKAAFDAMAACEADVAANPEYADLKKEKEEISTQMREMWRGGRNRRDRAAREERMKKFRALRTRSNEVREKMAKLTTEVKGLAELKTKKDEAVAAFLTKYQAALDANKEYTEAAEELKKIEAMAGAVGEQMRTERTQRFRAEREERRKKAEELKKKEAKPGEVENPFDGVQ